MKVKEVVVEYHKLVPFPWTPRKIRKAGFDPTALVLEMGRKIEQCEDSNTPAAMDLLSVINELKLLGG